MCGFHFAFSETTSRKEANQLSALFADKVVLRAKRGKVLFNYLLRRAVICCDLIIRCWYCCKSATVIIEGQMTVLLCFGEKDGLAQKIAELRLIARSRDTSSGAWGLTAVAACLLVGEMVMQTIEDRCE